MTHMITFPICFFAGMLGGWTAVHSGYHINEWRYWLMCLPFWIVGMAISFYIQYRG